MILILIVIEIRVTSITVSSLRPLRLTLLLTLMRDNSPRLASLANASSSRNNLALFENDVILFICCCCCCWSLLALISPTAEPGLSMSAGIESPPCPAPDWAVSVRLAIIALSSARFGRWTVWEPSELVCCCCCCCFAREEANKLLYLCYLFRDNLKMSKYQ